MIIECPRHQGSFDCSPFCDLCEGEQEYETNNEHTQLTERKQMEKQYKYEIEIWTAKNQTRQIKTSKIFYTANSCRRAMLSAVRRTDRNPELYAIGRVVEVNFSN